jgi:hypothetical protein
MAGWFLQFQGSKFGPLSIDEVKVVLGSGKLSGPLFAWKQGMHDWEPVERVNDLAPFLKTARPSTDQRVAKRIPFMAAVKFSGAGAGRDLAVFTGICRDLSKGGMQVMSSSTPGYPGSLLTLSVEPVSDSTLPRFSCEGVIVRLLPNNAGFSVRFRELSSANQDALSKCLKGGTRKTKTRG